MRRVVMIAALGLVQACAMLGAGDGSKSGGVKGDLTRLKAETILPPAFGKALPTERQTRVLVPPKMLLMTKVSRPRAEVRSGPGTQFELSDVILPEGTKVLAFAKVGVWRKVLVLGTWQSGWVHSLALDEPTPNANALAIDMRRLPTVIVMHDVSEVQSFGKGDDLPVAIPRGAQFRSLRSEAEGSLVWLPQTNSVMWMSRKDVQ